MAAAVKNSYERGNLKQSLSAFKAANTEVYEKACLRLPADFDKAAEKLLSEPRMRLLFAFCWQPGAGNARIALVRLV